MKRGHEPQRSCLGCGERDNQKAMIRLVVGQKGELAINQVEQGRGGYLHKREDCWSAFLRRKSLYRAFHVEVGREAKEKLIQELCERNWE